MSVVDDACFQGRCSTTPGTPHASKKSVLERTRGVDCYLIPPTLFPAHKTASGCSGLAGA